MTVYADILMLVNFIVDYFLILMTSKFLHTYLRLWRLIISAAIGGIFSLYIFLPQSNLFFEITIHILMCAVLSFVAFGFGDVKSFFRSTAVLICVNFGYSGAMVAVWLIFKPYGMVINNSVIYFDISPLFLIIFSVIGYFLTVLLRKILKKPFSQNTYCDVKVFCNDKNLTLSGIADTGNSLTDVFGLSQIFITEEETVNALLGEEKQNPVRFRKIPCETVVGERMLNGYRIDLAEVYLNNKKYVFKNPVLAISNTPLNNCKIIINPENLN